MICFCTATRLTLPLLKPRVRTNFMATSSVKPKAAAKLIDSKTTALKKIQSELTNHLQDQFGFDAFKNPQEEIIQSLLNGKDTFVIMPTGGGKSLCYQLPAIISKGCAIIVSPLIALMKNQVDLVRGYNSSDDIAHFLNSTLNKGQQKTVKEDLISGKTKLLYVAPETLTKEENVDFFKDLTISFLPWMKLIV